MCDSIQNSTTHPSGVVRPLFKGQGHFNLAVVLDWTDSGQDAATTAMTDDNNPAAVVLFCVWDTQSDPPLLSLVQLFLIF